MQSLCKNDINTILMNNNLLNDTFESETKLTSDLCLLNFSKTIGSNAVASTSIDIFNEVQEVHFHRIVNLMDDLLDVVEVVDSTLHQVELCNRKIKKQEFSCLENFPNFFWFLNSPSKNQNVNSCSQPFMRKKYQHKISSTFPTSTVNVFPNFTCRETSSACTFATEIQLSETNLKENKKEKLLNGCLADCLQNCESNVCMLDLLSSQHNFEKEDIHSCSQPIMKRKYQHEISSTFPTTSVGVFPNFTGIEIPRACTFATEIQLSETDLTENKKEKLLNGCLDDCPQNCTESDTFLSDFLSSQHNMKNEDILNCNISIITSQVHESECSFSGGNNIHSSFGGKNTPCQNVSNDSFLDIESPVKSYKVNFVVNHETKKEILSKSVNENDNQKMSFSSNKSEIASKINCSNHNLSMESLSIVKQQEVNVFLLEEKNCSDSLAGNVSMPLSERKIDGSKSDSVTKDISLTMGQELNLNNLYCIKDSISINSSLDLRPIIPENEKQEMFFTSTPASDQNFDVSEKKGLSSNSFSTLKTWTQSAVSFDADPKIVKNNETWFKFVNSSTQGVDEQASCRKSTVDVSTTFRKNITNFESFESCCSNTSSVPELKSTNGSVNVANTQSQSEMFSDSLLGINMSNIDKVLKHEGPIEKLSVSGCNSENETNTSSFNNSESPNQVLINTASGQLITRCPTLEPNQESKVFQWKPIQWKRDNNEKENNELQSVPDIDTNFNTKHELPVATSYLINAEKHFSFGLHDASVNNQGSSSLKTRCHKCYDIILPSVRCDDESLLQCEEDNLESLQCDDDNQLPLPCDNESLLQNNSNNLLSLPYDGLVETQTVPQVNVCQSSVFSARQPVSADEQKVPNSKEIFLCSREEVLYEDDQESNCSSVKNGSSQTKRKILHINDGLSNCDSSLVKRSRGEANIVYESRFNQCVEKLYPLHPLKTCSRPLRIGLSRRRKTTSLHRECNL